MEWLLEIPPSLIIGIFVGGVVLFLLGFIFIVFKKKMSYNHGLPQSVWKKLMKDQSIPALLLMIGMACLTAILFLVFRQPFGNALEISYSIFVGLIIFWSIIYLATRTKRNGQMLLHIRFLPYNRIKRRSGIILTVVGSALLLLTMVRKFEEGFWIFLFASLFYLSQGIYSVILSFSHLGIHANGIQAYLDFIPWNKIESYSWVSDNHATALQYKLKGKRLWFMSYGAIPVPIRKKMQLEAILAEYIPEGGLPAAN